MTLAPLVDVVVALRTSVLLAAAGLLLVAILLLLLAINLAVWLRRWWRGWRVGRDLADVRGAAYREYRASQHRGAP